MSGHSKWHNIQAKKGKADAARGKIFTKLGRELLIAVKQGGPDPSGNSKLKEAITTIKDELYDAKEYGSILTITPQDWDMLYARLEEVKNEATMYGEAIENLRPLIQVAQVLSQKYDVVVTNPPYMGSANMNAKLTKLVKKKYPDSKRDLFAVFIERCNQMVKKDSYYAMVTQHSWMFLSSFEKLRDKLLDNDIG